MCNTDEDKNEKTGAHEVSSQILDKHWTKKYAAENSPTTKYIDASIVLCGQVQFLYWISRRI